MTAAPQSIQPTTEPLRQPERCRWCGALEPTSCEVCDEAINILKAALEPEKTP